MNDFGLGQKFLQSVLTFYTPVDHGHTKDPFWAYRNVITTARTGADGKPTRTETLAKLYGSQTSVLTDYQGRPTSTVTYYVVPHAKTLFDSDGKATATTSFTASEVAMTYVLRNAKGIATATVTSMVPMSSSTVVQVVTATPTSTAGGTGNIGQKTALRVSDAQYFVILMLPTLLAIALAIPIRILDRTAKLYQPFHAMTSKRSAPASESLCLETRSPRSLLARFHSALNGQWLLSLTGSLVLASAVLIPLSGEMMHIAMRGSKCVTDVVLLEDGEGGSGTPDSTPDCATMGVAVLPHTARAVAGILAFMAILLCMIAVVLRRWKTGVAEPWSLHYVAYLASNDDIQLLLRRLRGNGRKGKLTTAVTHERINKMFGDKAFFLGYWTENAMTKYGIQISQNFNVEGKQQQPLRRKGGKGKVVTFDSATKGNGKGKGGRGTNKHDRAMPFFLLTFAGRLMFLAFLCAVLIFVLVYHIMGEARIGWIVIGESIGVRILFTILGVLIAIAWESFFYTVAFLSPFRFLQNNNGPKQDSRYKHQAFHMTPPTNVFSGAWLALSGRNRRPRDVYLGAVATAGIFAEFLPLLLSNVPFDAYNDDTDACTWISVATLCAMMFVIVASFVVRWPYLPVDPTTVAGAMYYASDPTTASIPLRGEGRVPDALPAHYRAPRSILICASAAPHRAAHLCGNLVRGTTFRVE
ncbi:hypothetical protein SLS62_006109 [Diatrype stigma]|uniref:Uncharacterized protein n=1 Tax=Diatrype stigma TaxID=117547 RepID=A0AAN9URK9_9PEZI